jgi:hypothetical protein
LRRGLQAELVREYETGYRVPPEDERDVEAALATAVALLRTGCRSGSWSSGSLH